MAKGEWNKGLRKALAKSIPQATKDGLELILKESNNRVPVDTGDLKRSGRVVLDEGGGYVTYDEPYAVYVHEDLTANHPRGGQAKFLENGVRAAQGEVFKVVGKDIRGSL